MVNRCDLRGRSWSFRNVLEHSLFDCHNRDEAILHYSFACANPNDFAGHHVQMVDMFTSGVSTLRVQTSDKF